ncbi:MAG: hypothetical protein DRO89_03775 [Candidatus Altiarchaeales archaeon]|nr:MAG: hypothetical protein DRO89_03775 [Candidatus Altiarchaeales archaeon]
MKREGTMKREGEIMILLVLVIGILINGCVQEKMEVTTTSTISAPTIPLTTITTSTTGTTTTVVSNLGVGLSLSTDKETYRSNELMNITVTINSSSKLSDVNVRVYGINARHYRLDKTEKMDLNVGTNTVTFSYKTPRCYGCAGITPGIYQINADLSYNNNVIASTTVDVEIKQ